MHRKPPEPPAPVGGQTHDGELTVQRSGQPDRRVAVGEGVTTLGRAEDNDVVLSDLGVSRRHARLHIQGGRVQVEDLGSGNGTHIRGRRVERELIEAGEMVVIDPFTLSFQIRLAAPPFGAGLGAVTAAPLAHNSPARLVVLNGHRLAPAYPLVGPRFELGRSEDKDVVLFDPSASRNHASIQQRGLRHWLEDLGSANGTFLNGRRVREYPLSQGDRVRIGSTEFLFETLGEHTETSNEISLPVAQTATELSLPLAEPSLIRVPPMAPQVTRRQEWMNGALLGMALVFLVVGLSVTGMLFWRIHGQEEARRTAVPELIAAEELPEVEAMMSQGRLLFHEGHFLDAAAQFYKVLKADPAHPDATRLGFLACEFIGFAQLREDIVVQNTPVRVRKRRYREALALTEKALRGDAMLADARALLDEASAFFPGDGALRGASRKVREATVAEVSSAVARALRASLRPQLDQARALLSNGRLLEAIQLFERVQAGDPDRGTYLWYDAEDGIGEARARLGRASP